MRTFFTLVLFFAIACGGGLSEQGEPEDLPNSPSVPPTIPTFPTTEMVAPVSDAGGEVQFSSCGTGVPSWQPRPYLTCVEFYGPSEAVDPRCGGPIETDPNVFGTHAFQGPCPTKDYVGQCERRVDLRGVRYRIVETFTPNVYPWRPSDWYVRRDEFRETCTSSGGVFREPVPNIAPNYPCDPKAFTCPPDGGARPPSYCEGPSSVTHCLTANHGCFEMTSPLEASKLFCNGFAGGMLSDGPCLDADENWCSFRRSACIEGRAPCSTVEGWNGE